jgi:hypothetical protein
MSAQWIIICMRYEPDTNIAVETRRWGVWQKTRIAADEPRKRV